MRVRHGWTLNGPLSITNTSQSEIKCHRITVCEANDRIKELLSLEAIRSMFEMDFNDHKVGPDERSFSQEDKAFLTKMDDGICLINGHYETPLPFRNSVMILPNNRSQVLTNKPPTRRGIWSTVPSVYDPLGFVALFILPAKKILQDLCRENIGWDDEVSDEYRIRWGEMAS